jgi:hypothetical protein
MPSCGRSGNADFCSSPSNGFAEFSEFFEDFEAGAADGSELDD